MQIIKELRHYWLVACFFIMPLIVWENHYHRFGTMKEFIFILGVWGSFSMTFIASLLYEKITVRFPRLTVAVFLYGVYQTVSWAIFPYTDRHYFWLLSGSFVLFAAVSLGTKSRERNWILHALLLAALITSVYGWLQFFRIPPFTRFGDYFGSKVSFGIRIFSTFGHPTLLGSFCAFILPVSAVYFVTHIRQKRWMFAFYFGLIFGFTGGALLMSQTRSAWIGTLCSFIFFTAFQGKTFFFRILKKRPVLSIICACLLAGSIAGGWFWLKSSSSLHDLGSFKLRLNYYGTSVNMIRERPFFGRGIGTFSVYYPAYRNHRTSARLGEPISNYWVAHPHNEHLELLHDGGIVGYGLFIWIVVETLILLFRTGKLLEAGLAASLVALLCDGLFSQSLRSAGILALIWLVAGFANMNAVKKTPRQPQRRSPLKTSLAGLFCLVIFAGSSYSAYRMVRADYYLKGGANNYFNNFPHIAIRWFQEAHFLNRSNPLILYYLASSYGRIEHTENAIKSYETLLEIDPHFLDANFSLAECYRKQGTLERSQQYFERQIAIDNMHWKSYSALIEIEHHRNNKQRARLYLQEVHKIAAIANIDAETIQRMEQMLAFQ